MQGYMGEFDVNISDSPFANYEPFDWAMYFIERFGQIDGDHHKLWVMDQIARIYNGVEVIVKLAKWDNGQQEYRVWLGDKTTKYEAWVLEMRGKYDPEENEYEYDYDKGCAP